MALRGVLPQCDLEGELDELGENSNEEVLFENQGRPVSREKVVRRLVESVTNYFPQFAEESEGRLRGMANEAFELADQTYGMAEAVKWAHGFVIPASAVAEDVKRLHAASGCLVTMARRERELRRGTRLSAERVNRVLSEENPERDKLYTFGEAGVPVPVSTDFEACGIRNKPMMRQKYVETQWAVDRMIYEGFWTQGLAFILPITLVSTLPNRVHLSQLSWAPKQGKAKGRNICDTGDKGRKKKAGPPVLNSKEVKEHVDALWGEIKHPTLTDIVNMCLDFFAAAKATDPNVKWEDLVLWKMDLSGAFTLLDFKPDDVPLMGAEMANGHVVFFGCGIFGWTAMPAAFQVVNRAIVWELSQPGVLAGLMKMYTDDAIGVCLDKDLLHDLKVTRDLCTNLLGDNAVEDSKTESGRRLTVIGWDIDLDRQLVTIARNNALKALYGFTTVPLNNPVETRTIQKWASWGQRYGEICVYMQPFRKILYSQIHPEYQNKCVLLEERTKTAVRLYGALVALILLREQEFSRPMVGFGRMPWRVLLEFDGSLSGSGVIWYRMEQHTVNGQLQTHEVPLGGCAVDLRALGFGSDTQYQNSAEFISVVVGQVGIKVMDWDAQAVKLRGDSETALMWASGHKYKSTNVMNAAMVYACLCADTGFHVVETQRLKSEVNWRADRLSRRWDKYKGVSWSRMTEILGSRDQRLYGLREVSVVMVEILSLCDPKACWEGDVEFGAFWRRTLEIVKML